MRFEKGMLIMREKIKTGALGKILSVRSKFVSYLPVRHPGTDYRKEYVCKKIGGGVV